MSMWSAGFFLRLELRLDCGKLVGGAEQVGRIHMASRTASEIIGVQYRIGGRFYFRSTVPYPRGEISASSVLGPPPPHPRTA